MPPVFLRLAWTAALAWVLLLAGCPVATRLPQPPPDGPIDWEAFDGPRMSREIAQEANRVRVGHGLRALYYSAALEEAADEQAVHLVMINGVGHSNPVPGEETVAARVTHLGVDPAAVAENALMEPADYGPPAVTYHGYAALLVAAWMDSPGHRANLLNPTFSHTACAARLGHTARPGRDRVYAVQVFVLPDTRSATVRQVPH
jgi:uncharacterized protein YkwD